eukprot:scaffold16335_cov27-Phaeocystis_antarctica.AAC.3
MRVDLVRDVKDDGVGRRVKDEVQRDGQLHHAQRGTQVATRLRHRVDRLPPASEGLLVYETNPRCWLKRGVRGLGSTGARAKAA